MSNPRLPYIRLTIGQDDDLISWLTQLESLPYGSKGQMIKQTLRRGLGLSSSSTKQTDTSTFDSQELLSDIRRVLDASLEGCLSRLSITPHTPSPHTSRSTPNEIDAILDDFGANLMMLDEEDLDA